MDLFNNFNGKPMGDIEYFGLHPNNLYSPAHGSRVPNQLLVILIILQDTWLLSCLFLTQIFIAQFLNSKNKKKRMISQTFRSCCLFCIFAFILQKQGQLYWDFTDLYSYAAFIGYLLKVIKIK